MNIFCVVSPQSKSGVVPVADSLPETMIITLPGEMFDMISFIRASSFSTVKCQGCPFLELGALMPHCIIISICWSVTGTAVKLRGDHAERRRSVTGLPAVCERAVPQVRTRINSMSDADLVFMTVGYNGLLFKFKAEDSQN